LFVSMLADMKKTRLPLRRRSSPHFRAIVRPARLQPLMDAPQSWPSTRPRIAFVRRPQTYRCPQCPYLSYGRPRSRPEHLASIYEIPSSARIRQNRSECNRRYKKRRSTCSDVLLLPHPCQRDRVPVSRWVQGGLDFVLFASCRYHIIQFRNLSRDLGSLTRFQQRSTYCSLAMFHNSQYGSVLAQSHALAAQRFLSFVGTHPLRCQYLGRTGSQIGSKFRIQTRLPETPRLSGVSVVRKCPSGSVHAR
jgi:hypothetical protein